MSLGRRGEPSTSVLSLGRDDEATVPPAPFEPRPGTIPTLPVPDAAAWRTLHLVGVGGAGMRNIARLLMARGIRVTGSDLKDSPNLRRLRDAGATVFAGHRAEQLGSPDAVVVSTAVPASNPEVRRAAELGIPVLARAQVLAALTRGTRLVARRRHPRQDHDDVDDLGDAPARRPLAHVHHRRRPQRERIGCRDGRGGSVRRRGRRERWDVPAARSRDRRDHERRTRPPGLLPRSRRHRVRVRHLDRTREGRHRVLGRSRGAADARGQVRGCAQVWTWGRPRRRPQDPPRRARLRFVPSAPRARMDIRSRYD